MLDCCLPTAEQARRYGTPESVQVLPNGIRSGYRPSSLARENFPCHTGSCRMGAAGFSACSVHFDRLHLSNRCNQWIVLIANESVT
ncbi:hypothetical protein SSKA14_2916 [Stenotrophomonas sp. SKA14]|nr:hypothetical protein SSKA14_2916 [Stenotrophomonas sp. SKA14]